MRVFTLKDSEIRLRSEDVSLKSYLNRRFPTVVCADPYHECDYGIRLILRDEMDEDDMHVVRHHEMFKALIQESSFIKTLYLNAHSWSKNFLYDPSIKFEMFSSYEFQIVFLHFLNLNSLLKITHDEMEPTEWLKPSVTCPTDIDSPES